MATSLHLVSTKGVAQVMTARQFTLLADEPPSNHGTDTGPAPYELLLASLAACSSATLRLYADRKGWDLGTITADLKFHRDPEGNENIERVMSFSASLTDEQRNRLAEIVEKTPVTKTVRRGVIITTTFS